MSFAVAGDKYDRFMGRYSRELAPRFMEFAGVRAGTTAVDVGCGPGALTERLVAELGPESVSAADPSEPFVAAATERAPGADVRQAAAEELPWEDDRFDAALSQLVVNFMRDADAGVSEMRRVVKPGGTVAACTWDYGRDMEMLRSFWDAARRLDSGAPDEGSTMRYRSVEELDELWRRVGVVGRRDRLPPGGEHVRRLRRAVGAVHVRSRPGRRVLRGAEPRAARAAPRRALHRPGQAGRRVHARRDRMRGARRGAVAPPRGGHRQADAGGLLLGADPCVGTRTWASMNQVQTV